MPGTDHDPAMNLSKIALTLVTAKAAPESGLAGRRAECAMLDRLVADVRAGQSRVLVLRGEPGTGKTALLDYLAGHAAGCRLVRVAGMEPEIEFPFAGLHQLLAPMLDRLGQLPGPQRDALRTVFGLSAGPAPERFLVALAVLSLLSEVARERPLVCVVDDAQWLNQASAQVLAFVARHLDAVPAAVIFAVREPADARGLVGLPEFQLGGLADADARRLLDSVLIGPLDERVRDQLIAEARGNPRALLEVPRGLTPAELAGGFGLPSAVPVPNRVEADYRRKLALLPAATQLLLLIAAAELAGDPVRLWRAAGHLGVPAEAAEPAAAAGLVEFSGQIRFCHPHARAAIYQAATPRQRQSVHRALAQTADSDLSPDRRAWHRANATPHLDEDVAAELIRSVDLARTRGGLAAAAAFGERAAELSPEPARRARRALDAAQAKREAGAPDAARRLLAMAQSGLLDELGRARAELLHAQLATPPGYGRHGRLLLLDAAKRLEPLDAGLAREAYREAFGAALTAGRLGPASGTTQVAEAVRAPGGQHGASRPPRPTDLLLDGLAALVIDGHPGGAPMLTRALTAFRHEAVPAAEALRWLPFACRVAREAWDDESWQALSARLIEVARQAGALTALPDALQDGTALCLATGETAMAHEAETVAAATGHPLRPDGALLVAA
jgi:hypothetical protein